MGDETGIVRILFYEDSVNPMDCDVFGVFRSLEDSVNWLKSNDWQFDTESCRWFNNKYRGSIEIIYKELQKFEKEIICGLSKRYKIICGNLQIVLI
jgi:hypothetical protein